MAKRHVSIVVSAAGLQASIWTKLDKAVRERGGQPEDIHRLATDEGDATIGEIAALIVGQTNPIPAHGGRVIGQIKVTAYRNQPPEQKVAAAGYNYADPNITSANFPHQRGGVEELMLDLVQFARVMTTDELDQVLPTFGGLPDMDDMLDTGVQHPDEQRKHPLVFLGASWAGLNGNRNIGYLNGDAEFRNCNLNFTNPQNQWSPDYVFPVRARKSITCR